ncbi:hypothetical protein K388_06973 [Streptomyces sp. KhCrAH-43]|uniref:hypothetical protein n=1 Tax=unclassified Streptomyces TaxID=2593676 RepID=UPI000369F300|nr:MULTISPECIES: hypothetical protein [unclassified Streptomyces]MYS39628.1 hypothetical protein [Streptomyces sp. SID4920]MYX64308.1 hypothetical protein [Streptomyces sp. SID8373]RAJ48625.1 hypothetical protein K388_06973 [Streptomyces sp. KhCrAH-43]
MTQHHRTIADRLRSRLATAVDARRRVMFGPKRDLGMETIEKLVLAVVVLGAAATFSAVFGTKFQELLTNFQGAF